MAKEYVWDVQSHRVCCVTANNKYQIFVDDEFLTTVYRKSFRVMMHDGLEEKISVCGKECLFLVWDETPDLVVDGVLLRQGIDYASAKEKREKTAKGVFRFMFWAGLGLLVYLAISVLLGRGPEIGWHAIAIDSVAAIWLMVYGGRKMWRLTHSENGSIMGKENSKGANLK